MKAGMRAGSRGLGLFTSLALALLGTVFVETASAGHVGCGDFIFEDTSLDSDIGPCGAGLTIAGSGIELDMNGHRLIGSPNANDGPGIRFDATTGSRVRNGTVSQFAAGVSIEGGSGNRISGMTIHDNVSAGDYGDGILVFESDNFRIINNQVVRNGVFSGMTIIDSSNGLIDGNNISQNNIPTASGLFTDIGIWILNDLDVPRSQGEPDVVGRQASFNVISNNAVQGNGLEGIQISRFAHDNFVRNNSVVGNGLRQRPGVRDGDGIAIFGNSNLVEDNRVFGNGGNGIGIQFTQTAVTRQGINNRILRNQTGNNGSGPNPPQNFDLFDGWPNCDNNVWRANTFQTFNQPCVTTP